MRKYSTHQGDPARRARHAWYDAPQHRYDPPVAPNLPYNRLTAPPATDVLKIEHHFLPGDPNTLRDPARLPPGQAITGELFAPRIGAVPWMRNPYRWTVAFTGRCRLPQYIRVDVLITLPADLRVQDFHCVSGWSAFALEWSGVTGQTLVDIVRPYKRAAWVVLTGADGFESVVPIDAFRQGLVAYARCRYPLSPDHGFPVRYVAPPGLYGEKSCKWLVKVEFTERPRAGFYEARGLDPRANVWAAQRWAPIDMPIHASPEELRRLLSIPVTRHGALCLPSRIA